jgi:hypothetical protein
LPDPEWLIEGIVTSVPRREARSFYGGAKSIFPGLETPLDFIADDGIGLLTGDANVPCYQAALPSPLDKLRQRFGRLRQVATFAA